MDDRKAQAVRSTATPPGAGFLGAKSRHNAGWRSGSARAWSPEAAGSIPAPAMPGPGSQAEPGQTREVGRDQGTPGGKGSIPARGLAAGYLQGELATNAYLVERGARSVADVLCRECDVDVAVAYMANRSVGAACRRLAPGWYTVTLYRHLEALQALDAAAMMPPGPARDWLLGTLFGYCDEEIARYVRRQATGGAYAEDGRRYGPAHTAGGKE